MANVHSLAFQTDEKHAQPVKGVLYPIQDTTVICADAVDDFNKHDDVLRYHRVSFSGTSAEPKATVSETLDLGHAHDFRSARTVFHPSGRQEVAVLSKTGLCVVAMAAQTSQKTTVRFADIAGHDPNGALLMQDHAQTLIIGYDPILTARRSLALLMSDHDGFAIVPMDMDSGLTGESWRLPSTVSGKAVAAHLLHRGSSTMLVLVMIEKGKLRMHAVAWERLARPVKAEDVSTLTLGEMVADGTAELEATITSLLAKAADQHLAIAWPDTAGTAKIALVGWDPAGALKLLATIAPEMKSPGGPICRLAAADLLHTGTDQLVFAHPVGTNDMPFGPYLFFKQVELMLFAPEDPGGAAPKLHCFSKLSSLVETPPSVTADHEMRIAAGVFGSCMGVQVTHTLKARTPDAPGQDMMNFAFVAVDPDVGFRPDEHPRLASISVPPGPLAPPLFGGWLRAVLSYGSFPSDLAGQSVRLGEPTLHAVDDCRQILAIIQAPPYDTELSVIAPNITFSQSSSDSSGYSVAVDNTYTLSKDFGANLQIGSLSLGQTVHDAWTNSFNKSHEKSEAKDVNIGATGDTHDLFLVYGMSYNVWRYPVVQSSAPVPGNEILVVVPMTAAPSPHIIPAFDPSIGYRPRSEVGMLLSYVGVEKDGFTAAKRLFDPQGISVSESPGGSSAGGGILKANGEATSKHYSVINSISSSAHLTLQTELFDFLPISFGMNIAKHETFADQTVDTTHVTGSSHMNWHVASGHVRNAIYSYEISPYIYIHDKLGCLVIAWDVDLSSGANYNPAMAVEPRYRRLDDPDICLIRVAPLAADAFQKWFTRSIAYVADTPGKVTIEVEVFNNSINPAKDVTCEFFQGKPTVVKHEGAPSTLDPPKETLLGTATSPGLHALGRTKLTLSIDAPTKTPSYIVVRVSCKDSPRKRTYWNLYPADGVTKAHMSERA